MDSIQSLEALRAFVQTTLCERHALDPRQFPMIESVLTRGGKPCGLYFCQDGPRQMRAHAIWDALYAVIAFYDSSGTRFQKVQLTQDLDPTLLAA